MKKHREKSKEQNDGEKHNKEEQKHTTARSWIQTMILQGLGGYAAADATIRTRAL